MPGVRIPPGPSILTPQPACQSQLTPAVFMLRPFGPSQLTPGGARTPFLRTFGAHAPVLANRRASERRPPREPPPPYGDMQLAEGQEHEHRRCAGHHGPLYWPFSRFSLLELQSKILRVSQTQAPHLSALMRNGGCTSTVRGTAVCRIRCSNGTEHGAKPKKDWGRSRSGTGDINCFTRSLAQPSCPLSGHSGRPQPGTPFRNRRLYLRCTGHSGCSSPRRGFRPGLLRRGYPLQRC